MADEKKTIVVYSDWASIFEQLEDDEAGKLIKHFFKYINDENPEMEDRLLKMAFEPIKMQLKRDLTKWEQTKQRRAEAGKKGGRPTNEEKAKKAIGFQEKQTKAKKAVNVNENVNDNVNVNVSTIVDGEKAAHANFEIIADSDKIKNPTAEKEKSSAKKENANEAHAEVLKSAESESWLEAVAMQNRKTISEIKSRIDDFVKFLATVDRIHPSKREFLEHFINWLKKNVDRPEPRFQNKGSSGAPKFSINQ